MAKKDNQPTVDRDSSYNLINPFKGDVKSVPDAERETAFQDQEEITGTVTRDDPYGNEDETRIGFKKDKSRIADKANKKVEESIFDKVLANRFGNLAETSHTLKKLSGGKHQGKVHKRAKKYANEEVENEENAVLEYAYGATGPVRSTNVFGANDERSQRAATTVVRRGPNTGRRQIMHTLRDPNQSGSTLQRLRPGIRGINPKLPRITTEENYLPEAENPGVAAAPVTSDNPTLGMYAMNGLNGSSNQKMSIKPVLEGIALQAAESFEALDDNANVPDFFVSELAQCAKVLDRLYSFVTSEQKLNPAQDGSPVSGQNFMTKEDVDYNSNINDPLLHKRRANEHNKAIEQIHNKIGLLTNPTHLAAHVLSTREQKRQQLDAFRNLHANLANHEMGVSLHKQAAEMLQRNPEDPRAIKMSNAAHKHSDNPLNEEYLDIDESEKREKFLNATSKLDGKEGLSSKDFEMLRARKKLEEAMFGTFAYLVRERNSN